MRIAQVLVALILLGGLAAAGLYLGTPPPPPAVEAETRPMTSADCTACHPVIAEEVARSWHGQAYTDPEVLALTRNFQDEACVSCHAPAPVFQAGVGERVFARRERREDGVDCISCHQMPDGRVAGTRGLSDAPCRPALEPRLAKVVFCAGCHNQHWTVDEWFKSPYADGRGDCEIA